MNESKLSKQMEEKTQKLMKEKVQLNAGWYNVMRNR